jgi:hypothetical protein
MVRLVNNMIIRFIYAASRLYESIFPSTIQTDTQGVVVIAHASTKVPCIPDYSTISRRVNRLDIKINEKLGNDIVIALDGTGIKVANLGEWMRHKWHVKKGISKDTLSS